MKKKVLKISAFCMALLLTVGVLAFANSLVGNPISKLIARNTAKAYIADRYANTDYAIEDIFFSFKDGNYYVRVSSPSSMDGRFTLRVSMLGQLRYDDYDSRVTGHGNAADRLDFEYRDKVDAVLNSSAYPYDFYLGYGRLKFDREMGAEVVEGAVSRSELVNDRIYDVGKLGEKNGELMLYIENETVTSEKAAEILLKTKEIMEQAGIYFHSLHFVLMYPPYDGESNKRPEGKIDLKGFLYSDIYEDGLAERIENFK